jgi:hypothetical protein
MLRVGLGFEDTLSLVEKDGAPITTLSVDQGADSPVQGFYLEWQDFLHQCRTGCASVVDATTVIPTTALIEAASRWDTSRLGRAVA